MPRIDSTVYVQLGGLLIESYVCGFGGHNWITGVDCLARLIAEPCRSPSTAGATLGNVAISDLRLTSRQSKSDPCAGKAYS